MPKQPVPVIVANWKMNGLLLESMQLFKKLRKNLNESLVGCEIVVCPPFTLLRDMAEKVPGSGVKLGGQNCHHEAEGAYTGEISARMLHDMTCDYVILGHSERRRGMSESSDLIFKKAVAAHREGLTTIICVGETALERDKGLEEDTVRQQLAHSIPPSANEANTIIAYEPVWSIGTDQVPTKQQIEEMHRYIINVVRAEKSHFKSPVRVIYGGSANGDNAKDILAIDGVNGLLVGRASLDAEQFWNIVTAAS